MLFTPLLSSADDESRGNRTKATAAMSQKVFKKLQEAQELAEQKNYSEVHELLDYLRSRRSLSVYETAQVWNYTAYTYYLQERYDEAIDAYQQVLNQGALPDALTQSTLKTLSQLYFVVENYQQALTSINQILAMTEEPAADVYVLLGQAHFQLKQFKEALQPIRTAIQISRQQGQRPKENWLLLLQVIYYELEDYPRMVAVLKELIQLYPKDRYLITLAAVYSQLGDTAKQLAITEVLYEKGYLKASHQIMNLANLYMLHGLPFKAGALLEKELAAKRIEESENNLRLLSQAWHQAREYEKAIPPLEQAAASAQAGELYVRLAQSYINLERWNDAVQALQKGLAKGGLRRPDTAHIMLGMALFNQNKFTQARTVFEKALTDRRSQKIAEEWLSHVESEIERRTFLQEEAFAEPSSAQQPPG
jgi:tetratricopeptide (TPR) repeat protein